jgi:archaellum component FlaF (FlaF/FlaG flagellin family)
MATIRTAGLVILFLLIIVPLASSQTTLVVTASTDKNQYVPFETIAVFGRVTQGQNNLVPGAGVSVQVNDPRGSMVHLQLTYSDSSGTYSDKFILPQGSAQGLYRAFVSASKAGFSNGQAQTTFWYGLSGMVLTEYSWPTVGPITGVLTNVRSAPINIGSADVFLAGFAVSFVVSRATLAPQESCSFTITPPAGMVYMPQAPHPLKLIIDGEGFAFTVIYGGSSNLPQQGIPLPLGPQTGVVTAAPTTNTLTAFSVPPRYDYYFYVDLNSGDIVAFSFSASSWHGVDDISFTLVSSTRSVLLNVGRVSQYLGNYSAVFPGRYYLRFDNGYSIFTTKTISLSYSVTPRTLGIETYQWNETMITGSLRNYGASYVDTKNAQVSLNGIALRWLGGTCSQTTLKPGWTCSFSITVPNATWVQGRPYVVNLVTPTGNFAFPVVAGGNSESLIETQPNLITFQTVNTETIAYQTQNTANQGIFSRDFFMNNAFSMIGALAGGILLIGAVVGLFAISIAQRNTGKGLYGEDENRGGDSRRNIPILIIIALGALGLLTVSVLTPRMTFSFYLLASRVPYLVAATLVLIMIASSLGFTWVVAAILRGRRKSLRNIESEKIVFQRTPQTDEILVEQVEKMRCHYCGADVPSKDSICGKCGMPAMYRK